MRAEQHLFALPLLEAFIAHRESGRQGADDPETVSAVVNELLSHQSDDGSWGNSVALTSEALLLLADLRIPGEKLKNVERAQQWLRRRRGIPGMYVDGCSAERHELAICEHFAGGFFSPAPPNRDLTGTRLANGLVFPSDADARLGLSALALHALLRWRRASIDDWLHLDGLRRIANGTVRSNGLEIGVPTLILVLSVLTLAPRTPEFISVLHGALTRLAGTQRADGSWPNADPFHVAELYVEAHQAGYGSPVFDAAIARTAEMLTHMQHEDGSWGNEAGPYRLLSGWRTLRHAVRLVKS